MNKIIVIGSIVSVVILMIVPSIPAVEINTVLESKNNQMIEQIKQMNNDELKEKIEKINIQKLIDKVKTNEYSLITTSDIKPSRFGDLISFILYMKMFFIFLFFYWLALVPRILIEHHIYLPFWAFLIIMFKALLS